MLTFKVFAAWVWSSLSGQRDMAAIFNLNLELLIKFKKIHFEHICLLSLKNEPNTPSPQPLTGHCR